MSAFLSIVKTKAVAPPDPTDVTDFVGKMFDAFGQHQWQIFGALLLIGVVAIIRWVVPKIHGPIGDWLNTHRGGSILVLVTGIVSALGATLYTNDHITLNLIFGGITTAVMASGGWNVIWDIFAPNDLSKSKGGKSK